MSACGHPNFSPVRRHVSSAGGGPPQHTSARHSRYRPPVVPSAFQRMLFPCGALGDEVRRRVPPNAAIITTETDRDWVAPYPVRAVLGLYHLSATLNPG
jgi:hypothetical protein